VREEERAVEVEGEQLLPVGERQLVDGGCRLGDHGAAPDRVHEDVDPSVGPHDVRDDSVHGRRVERVGDAALGAAAGVANRRHGLVEPALVGVDPDDDSALGTDDLRRRLPNPARRRRDERDSIRESHDAPPFL
jgi:hypothetical protein